MSTYNDEWTFSKASDGHRWSRHSRQNGQCVGRSTEGYVNKSDCEANATRNGMPPDGPTDVKVDTWRIYNDEKGEYRWRRTAPNGNIVGAAHEGYVKRVDCVANAKRHGYPDD